MSLQSDRSVSGNRWFVAQTSPRKEAVALANLHNQGFLAYCPRVARTKRHARKFTTVREPLFPGYVFVAIDLADQPWRSINGTLGVTRILTDTAGPVAMQAGLVEHLIHTTEGARPAEDLVGQDVCLRTGPFADFVGRVIGLTAGQRVNVLLRLMNRDVVLGMNPADLDLMGLAA